MGVLPIAQRARQLAAYWRWVACTLPAVAWTWLSAPTPADIMDFSRWGNALLHLHLATVYASPANQTGPLQLVIDRLLMVGSTQGRPSRFVPAFLSAIAVLAAMAVATMPQPAARSTPTRRPRPQPTRRQVLVGLVTTLWLASDPWAGHPAEALIPLLWIAAATALLHDDEGRRTSTLGAALLLAAAAALAPWAVLALPLTLAVTSIRRGLVVALLAAAASVVSYAPFALTGRFALFHHVWVVSIASVWATVQPHLTTFDWTHRLVQSAFIVGGTTIAALWWRRDPRLARFLVPMVTVLLRVLSDPVRYDYYWLPVGILAVAALGCARGRWIRAGAIDPFLLLVAYLTWAALATEHQTLGALVALVIITAAGRPIGTRWLITAHRQEQVLS